VTVVLITLSAIVLSALVVEQLVRRGNSVEPADHPTTSSPQESQAAADRLDPAPYQKEIVALESLLYRSEQGGFDDASGIAHAVQMLSIAVRGDGTSRKQQDAFGRLFDYAGRVGARADVGYSTADIPQLRSEWAEVRDRVFRSADWFNQSSPELTAAQTRTVPVADPRVVRELERAARGVERLILRGKRKALSFPEASVDAGLHTRDAIAATRGWNAWSREWSKEVDVAGSDLPAHPGFDTDASLTMAFQELSQALGDLRNVTFSAASTSNIPFMYERKRHFESAGHHVEQARDYLATAKGG
jgi:hypothetical protein